MVAASISYVTLTGHTNNNDPPQVLVTLRDAILTHVCAAAGDDGDQIKRASVMTMQNINRAVRGVVLRVKSVIIARGIRDGDAQLVGQQVLQGRCKDTSCWESTQSGAGGGCYARSREVGH
jgi:hypothetical protein